MATNTAASFTNHTGNGTAGPFSISFSYLAESEVDVTVGGVLKTITTHYTFTSATQITFTSGNEPGNGVAIKFQRDTAIGSKKVDFVDGSVLTEIDLETNADQILFAQQEILDKLNTVEEGATADQTASEIKTLLASSPLDNTHLANNSVGTSEVAQDAVTTSKIAADAIVGAKIADNAISSEHYTDGSIDTEHIADDAVTAAKLANTSVTAGSYNTANITVDAQGRITSATAGTSNVVDGQITTAKLDDDAVTTDKLANSIVSDITANNAKITNVTTNLSTTTATGSVTVNSSDGTNATISEATSSAAGVMSTAHHDKLDGIESNATADQTASEIKTLLQSDKLTASEIATGALDGRYYTETESDAKYFNVSSGDTITSGDTFPDNDSTIATTKAINARIIDLVDDVGGFVPIASETAFPSANPDVNNGSGTLVSIKAIGSTRTPSGGTVTISNGAGSSTVTITGCGSTVLTAGFGVIVETTSTLHTYAFHRLVPKATEVSTVAANATNIAAAGANTTNINTVAGNNSNITTVAGISGNITTVAGVASNVTTVAGISSDVTTVANDTTDIGTLAAKATEIGRLGTSDAVADLNTLGTTDVVNDMNTLATSSNVSNMNTVAGSITNVNTAASNISNVNNFANTYQIASSNPSTDGGGNSLAAGDLYFNTSSNELRVYNGSAWQGGVTAIGSLAGLGANTFTGDQTISSTLPKLILNNTGSNPDYAIRNHNGKLAFHDQTNDTTRLEILSNGLAEFKNDVDIEGNLDVHTGLDVTGNITVSGTVDGIDIAALNSTVAGLTTNATHTGEVTGSGALTIADNVVDEANLKVSNSPTNGYVLTAQSGNTGGLTWAEMSAGVTSDSGGNTVGGTNAGDSITTGLSNTMFGKDAGTAVTTAFSNTFIGQNAGLAATTGGGNTGVGKEVFELLVSGTNNVAVGQSALSDVVNTNWNVGVGTFAGLKLTGTGNTALGYSALKGATGSTGSYNIGIGKDTGESLSTGEYNTLIGYEAGKSITDRNNNIFIGDKAGKNADVHELIGIGRNTLSSASGTGYQNIAIGNNAGQSVQQGQYNVLVGSGVGNTLANSSNNTAIGYYALAAGTTGGNNNTAIGWKAGYTGTNNLTTGSNNLLLGYNAAPSSATVSNEVTLGDANITKFRVPAIGLEADDGILSLKTGSGSVAEARFYCESSNAHYVAIKSPAHSAYSGNVSFVLPPNGGTNGYFLKTDGSGNTSWAEASGGGGLLSEDAQYNIKGGTDAGAALDGDTLRNLLIGYKAGEDINSGDDNICIGYDTGKQITEGGNNLLMGYQAGYTGTSFSNCVGLGLWSLRDNNSGNANTGVGVQSLRSTTSGYFNVAVGFQSGFSTTTGNSNTFLGGRAANDLSTGSQNTIIGMDAGNSGTNDITTGSNNILLGYQAAASGATVSNEITLGNSSISSLRCNTQTISSLSDRRDKTDINTLDLGLDFVKSLNPVKFKWETRDGNGKDGSYEAGFIAQDFQQLQKDNNADYLKLVMDENPDRLEASYGKLIPILVKAIQELTIEVETLKSNG